MSPRVARRDILRREGKELRPTERRLRRARSFDGDVRSLPQVPSVRRERADDVGPAFAPQFVVRDETDPTTPEDVTSSSPPVPPTMAAPAPTPIAVFEGLDREFWGAGSPPDTTGDVGPNHYIQAVNTSVGIFDKSTGSMMAAFTFNTLMSQGNFGNLCDTNNFGDPVVLYDTFEDRWTLTDFAFVVDGGGNVLAPAYQCFAVSKTGDPIAGGWNFYYIQVPDALNDYEKLGVWTDGIYMTANLFSFGAGSSFRGVRAWALNKAQMYAGSPTVQIVTFDIGAGDFTVVPSNARLQTGTPPPGRPNMLIGTWNFLNAVTVYKFHVDWNSVSLSTLTGPDVPFASTSWPNSAVANVPQSGTANLLDALQIRAMVQNQYTNLGGTESLWIPHTVRRALGGSAAPRWYQVDVTGGTVAANLPQAATWDPNGDNVIHRWMPSLAVDRAGNMAMGYSTSSSTTFPSIAYAGRLAGDPINTFSQTETVMFTGTAAQTTSTRWGDYSSMMLDPDGCRFWYTTEYANPVSQAFNMRWKTKIGTFQFPGCTAVGTGGTLSGTVTESPGGAPIAGATVTLGSRTTTTDGSGNYSFTGLPAGTYPTASASAGGYSPGSASNIVITDGGTTIQNFALVAQPLSACFVDTTQADFQTGVSTNCDLGTSPGNVILLNAPTVNQSNTAGTTTGTGFGTPNWTGQTFIPTVTGQLAKADIQVFCNGCGATPPNLTLSVRATSAGLPTGADLASVTVPGSLFASGASVLHTATFGTPATLTSGTQYALILRPVSVPTGSGYFWIRSSPSTYANGSRVLSADSGGTWSADTTRDFNFKVYMQTGFASSGTFESSAKDGNPAVGYGTTWSTLSWNATTPANTALQFQAAGSNSPSGPFNFVGPNGTAGTFFTTSGASLAQFNGFRYLKYKAFLATTDSGATPTLSDVTICFNNVLLPDLTLTKTNTVSGVTSAGNSWDWQSTIGNGAAGAASFATGQLIYTDTMPATGVAYGPPSIVSPSGITGTINCILSGGNVVNCTASGAVSIAAGGSFRVDVTATPSTVGTFTNPTGGLARVDPNSNVMETNEGNNDDADTVLVASVVSAGDLVIREFRTSGPAGIHDEYVEVLNKTAASLTLGATDGSAGFGIAGQNVGTCPGGSTQLLATIPNGTVIPAGGFYLAANTTAVTGYSLSNYGGVLASTADAPWTNDLCDNSGVALFRSSSTLDATTRVDAVGFVGSTTPYIEGAGIPVPASTGAAEVTYLRNAPGGVIQDTGVNANDFFLGDTNAATFGAVKARLASPGPQNASSEKAAGLTFALADPAKGATVFPNRWRTTTTATTGTYYFRWRVTNNTGAPITKLRIRVANVTTLNSPGYVLGGSQADFRFISSPDVGISVPGAVTALGLTPESPTGPGLDGGYHASASATLPGGTLANGASVYINVALRYAQAGAYVYFVSGEAK